MKYYIDTEFIEGFHKPLFGKRRHFIDLISIGIVAEDERSYYAISNEFNYKNGSDWVKENVIHPLGFGITRAKSNNQIAREIIEFCGATHFINIEGITEQAIFYGYYSDYDWVLFCSLFGTMMDLPKGFPMYCIDLKQTLNEKLNEAHNSDFFTKFHIEKEMTLDEKLIEIKKHTQYPEQSDEHNALADARWNKKLHEFLLTL